MTRLRSLPCFVLLLSIVGLAGCGGQAGASPAPTPTRRPPKPTATLTSTPYVVVASPTDMPTTIPEDTSTPRPTATASPSPTPAPTPTARPLAPRVVAAGVTPGTAQPGGNLTFTVTTLGDARKVQVYLTAGPGAAAGPFSYTLVQTSDGHWSTSVAAPSAGGEYSFSVGVFDTAGHRNVISAGSWVLSVHSAQPTVAPVEPLPDNMPLAPGFSYGNPQPAVFTGAGKVIHGAEVASTTDPSANGSALAQYFSVHLPRAGWVVDQSTVPPAGATSWSIAATSGSEVAVVQFGAGTIHIFYGSS
jgi:hypothetical protein